VGTNLIPVLYIIYVLTILNHSYHMKDPKIKWSEVLNFFIYKKENTKGGKYHLFLTKYEP
jgi:hypothetical protein